MTRPSILHLRADGERVQGLLARQRAFWSGNLPQVAQPAGGSTLYTTRMSVRMAPIPFLLRQADGSHIRDAERLQPDMFDVTAMVDAVANWQPAWEDGVLRDQGDWLVHAGAGDSIPIAFAPTKMPWVEAMLGCPIALVDGEPWIGRYPGDPAEVIARGSNFEHTPWFQLYLEFLRQLQARLGRRFPVTANTLIRGAGDLAAEVMGVQEACVAWIEQPQLMAKLLRVVTDAVLQMVEAGHKVVKPFQGGYPSIYASLAPGPVVSTQDDHSTLVSAKMYRQQILPYAREIVESCPYSVFHLHSGGLHIAPLLCDIPALSAIEVGIDSPPAEGRRPYEVQMLRTILERKAVILDMGPSYIESLAEYQGLLAQLPPGRLFARIGFEPAVYDALPDDFPGREVWMLE